MSSSRTAAAERDLVAARTEDALATYRAALAECDRVALVTGLRIAFGRIDMDLGKSILASNMKRVAALQDAIEWNQRRMLR